MNILIKIEEKVNQRRSDKAHLAALKTLINPLREGARGGGRTSSQCATDIINWDKARSYKRFSFRRRDCL